MEGQSQFGTETSPNSSLESASFVCSSIFWFLLTLFVIMAGATLLLIALGTLSIAGVTEINAAHVKLSVYYESLCPDSRRFIINQLHPTVQKLGGVSNSFLKTEYVPYGKATTEFVNGSFVFDCQHGDQECEGNKVHACALQKLSAADAAAFVNCSMSRFNSPITDPECAASLGLNYTKIQNCLDSWEAPTMLATNGIKTHDLEPKLYYVPWILINGEFSTGDLDLAQRDLLGLLCDRLELGNVTSPPECSGHVRRIKP